MGALPFLMSARISALAGSSLRYSCPSSTLKPSVQKCRMRSTGGAGRGRFALGSSITREGASSPPRVCAVPVKREGGGAEPVSELGGGRFLYG